MNKKRSIRTRLLEHHSDQDPGKPTDRQSAVDRRVAELKDGLKRLAARPRRERRLRVDSLKLADMLGGQPLEDAPGVLHFKSLVSLNTGVLGEARRALSWLQPGSEIFCVLDTETTGLSGGCGTLPFLVGLTYPDSSGQLTVEQWLLCEPAAESTMLKEMLRVLAPVVPIISWNGRTFDIPLLNNRLILCRLGHPLDGLPHLDLLPVARRLWKHRSPGFALQELEVRLLGEQPRDDIPGHQIPEAYFRFLREGVATQMQQILSHNREDMVNVVRLLALLERDRCAEDACLLDGPGLARQLDSLGRSEETMHELKRRFNQHNHPAQRVRSGLELGLRLKRAGRRDEARDVWRGLTGQPEADFSIIGFIELAKDLEHQQKDFSAALIAVETAMEFSLTTDEKEKLSHRAQRLRRKLKRI